MNAVLQQPEYPVGFFFDEPAEVYHRRELGVLSSSGIKQLLRSPAHYRHWATTEQEKDTDATRFGRAFHMALLEPERFARTYRALPTDAPRKPSITQREAKKPSPETIAAIEWWDAWEASGLIVLDTEDAERIAAMVASVKAHPWAGPLTTGGRSEVTLRWLDETTGLPCKARVDYFKTGAKRIAVDIKTCIDASYKGFGAAVARYDYDLQNAHYADGFRALGEPLDWYVLLAIESEAPYVCQPYLLDAAAEVRGYAWRQHGARILAGCMQAGRFPGYSDDILRLSLPAWAPQPPQE